MADQNNQIFSSLVASIEAALLMGPSKNAVDKISAALDETIDVELIKKDFMDLFGEYPKNQTEMDNYFNIFCSGYVSGYARRVVEGR